MTGVHCAVAFCKSNTIISKRKGEKLSFHKFPRNQLLRQKWMKFCRREKPFNLDNACICSKHFTKSDYDHSDVELSLKKEMNMDMKMRLKRTACPSIFHLEASPEREQFEFILESPEKSSNLNRTQSTDDCDDSSEFDFQIVSRKDLDNLKKSYASLMQENELLKQELGDLKKLYGIQNTICSRMEESRFSGMKEERIEEEELHLTDFDEKQGIQSDCSYEFEENIDQCMYEDVKPNSPPSAQRSVKKKRKRKLTTYTRKMKPGPKAAVETEEILRVMLEGNFELVTETGQLPGKNKEVWKKLSKALGGLVTPINLYFKIHKNSNNLFSKFLEQKGYIIQKSDSDGC